MSEFLSLGRGLLVSARLDKWWSCKIALLIACIFYATLARDMPDSSLLPRMLWLLLALCAFAAFGYSINSFSDRVVDPKAGKRNPFASMGVVEARAAMIVGLVACVLPVAVFQIVYRETSVVVLFAASYALAAAYSLAPLRLKERGFVGVLAAAVAQRTLPAVIVFEAMQVWDLACIMLCVLSTLIGIRYMLVHQISDESADRATGVRTFATEHGSLSLRHLLGRVVFPSELALLVVTLCLMSRTVPGIVPVVAFYLVWCALQIATRRHSDWSFASDTYKALAPFYYLVLPVTLAILLTMREPAFWPGLLIACIWTYRRLGFEIRILKRIIRGSGDRRRHA